MDVTYCNHSWYNLTATELLYLLFFGSNFIVKRCGACTATEAVLSQNLTRYLMLVIISYQRWFLCRSLPSRCSLHSDRRVATEMGATESHWAPFSRVARDLVDRKHLKSAAAICCTNQWLGKKREHLKTGNIRKPWFFPANMGCSCRFSLQHLKPIQWNTVKHPNLWGRSWEPAPESPTPWVLLASCVFQSCFHLGDRWKLARFPNGSVYEGLQPQLLKTCRGSP